MTMIQYSINSQWTNSCPTFFLFEKLRYTTQWELQFHADFKGGVKHSVSVNLMLILSTYRVVLHPSYLQKVFSFIIFIKER